MVQVGNFEWQQGADLVIELSYSEDTGDGPEPVQFTDEWSLRMDVVSEEGTRLFTFNTATGDEGEENVVGPEDAWFSLTTPGRITIKVPRSLTLGDGPIALRLEEDETMFYYDIFLRNPSDFQWPILRGQIDVEKSYTRWE